MELKLHPIHITYGCDSHGNVYSLKRSKPHLMTPLMDSSGFYYNFKVWSNKKYINYTVHKFVYECHHGIITDDTLQIDHINRVKTDNNILNLRIVTKSFNQSNRSKQKNNTSGYKGIYYDRNKWQARIKINGKRIDLGRYDTPEEAQSAYQTKEDELLK